MRPDFLLIIRTVKFPLRLLYRLLESKPCKERCVKIPSRLFVIDKRTYRNTLKKTQRLLEKSRRSCFYDYYSTVLFSSARRASI